MTDITIHEEMPGLWRVYGRRPASCDGFDELVEWLAKETGRVYNQNGIDALNKEIDQLEDELEEAKRALAAAKQS